MNTLEQAIKRNRARVARQTPSKREKHMQNRTVAIHLSSLLQSIENCRNSGNSEWLDKHETALETLVKNYLPSGSGFDSGTSFDAEESRPNKLVFHTSFHHMDEMGGYCGWTDHTVTVTPCFEGFEISVSGRNRNDIKDYIVDVFNHALINCVSYDEIYPKAA